MIESGFIGFSKVQVITKIQPTAIVQAIPKAQPATGILPTLNFQPIIEEHLTTSIQPAPVVQPTPIIQPSPVVHAPVIQPAPGAQAIPKAHPITEVQPIDKEADLNTTYFGLQESGWRPRVGMVFESFDIAETRIKSWAFVTVFKIRRGHKKTGQENLGIYQARLDVEIYLKSNI